MPARQAAVVTLSRREFLHAAGALCVAFHVPTRTHSAPAASFAPNAYLRIDRDGTVTITVAYVEMGQGTYTSIPMLVAEELEVPLSAVRVEHAPPDERYYGNPLLGGIQATGNSNAVRGMWAPMRRAGATARTLLVQAAAAQWGVDPASCRAESGTVSHSTTGRRLTYGELAARAAELTAPKPEHVSLKSHDRLTLIGTPAKRLDLEGKVNGTALFGIDVRVPGMKIATIAISPVVGGRLRSLDATAARTVPGVRQIVALDDAVAVVADHLWAAKQGLAAARIEWDPGPNGAVSTAGIDAAMAAASGRPGAVARSDGDVEAALAGARGRHDATYRLPFLAHATMEPMNCTAHVREHDCEVWVGTQVLARARAAAAEAAGLPVERVTVHNHLLGGGFGRRLEIDGVVRAVQVAKHVDAPVKLIYMREEDIQHDMYRPCFHDRLTAGLDSRGYPVAWKHRITGSSIVARWIPPLFRNGWDPETVDAAVDPPYALPNVRVEYVRHEPPGVPTAFWRGVGPAHNVFVVESFVDELAALAGHDSVAYRRALLAENPRARAVLDLAAEKAQWGGELGARRGRGIALQQAFGSYLAQVVEVEIADDGDVRVRRVVCAMDCGSIVNPDIVRAQLEGGTVFGLSAALYGEITHAAGRVQQTNFSDYPVLRMDQMPAMEVHLVVNREAPGGVGETATSCVMPALTNAVFTATGIRVQRLPIARQAARAGAAS